MKVLQSLFARSSHLPRLLIGKSKLVSPVLSYGLCKCLHNKGFSMNKNILLQHATPQNNLMNRYYSTTDIMPLNQYTDIVDETLEDIADQFENLADDGLIIDDFDCILADGVLTANLDRHGVYVINKQTPNRQIWLSSPISGPKRYDFVDNTWCYAHDDLTLHQRLNEELSELLEADVDFTHLAFGRK